MSRVSKPAVTIRVIASLLAAGFILTCGGDSGTGPDDTGGGNNPVQLDIALSSSSASPGDEVKITGIPADIDINSVYAVVTPVGSAASKSSAETAATAEVSEALLARQDDGTTVLLAPLNPAAPAAGGNVEIELTGPSLSSNRVTLQIAPLPEATLTVQDYVSQLQDLTTTWLAAQGTTREALRAMDPTTMEKRYIPLFIAQDILDSPDNPNSLRALVDGPIPFFDNETMDFDIANRMLSQTGIAGFFSEEINSIDSLNTAQPDAEQERIPAEGIRPVSGEALGCIPSDNAGISDASSLNNAMWTARFARRRLDGASGKVVGDVGNVVTALGVAPPLKAGATVVSGGLFVYKALNEAAGNLLPSEFDHSSTDFGLAGNKTVYNEDDTGGYWENFKVTAVSLGWKMDEFVLKAILKMGKFKDVGSLNIANKYTRFQERLAGYLITQGTKLVISEATGDENAFIEVCPGTWPNIDVSGPAYCEAKIVVGNSFELVDHTFFETRRSGRSEIRLATKSGGKVFGGAPPALKQKQIEVTTIEVEISPASVPMFSNDLQYFDATVQNASNDAVKWILPDGFTADSYENFGKTIVVASPESGWDTPVTLVARSLAETGSRKGKIDSDPRDGFALIVPIGDEQITVYPSGMCVPPGKPQLFNVIVTGLTDESVIWSASAGRFEGSTYYAPPSAVGEVTITATSVEKPSVKGTATITVEDCACWWTALVSGEVSGAHEGIKAIWQGGLFGMISLEVDESGVYPAITIGSDVPFAGPGTYEVLTIMAFAADQIYTSTDDPDAGLISPTLQIWSIDGTEMIGSLSGKLAKPIAVEPWYTIIDVNINFRAQDGSQIDPCLTP